MAKYMNQDRDARLEAELEAEEAEYRKKYGPKEDDESTEEVKKDPPVDTSEEETWKKRHSDLRSYTSKEMNKLTQKIAELEKGLQAKEKEAKLPANKSEMEDWVKEYPDLARVLGTLIDTRAEQAVSSVSEEVRSAKLELEAERTAMARERALNKILKAHPDFLSLIEQEEFKTWVEDQPRKRGPRIGQALYDALYENETDADSAIEAVNVFKSDTNAPKPKNSKGAAESIKKTPVSAPSFTDGKRTFKESEIAAMSDRDFEKYEEEIETAKREGRLVYDLSGALR